MLLARFSECVLFVTPARLVVLFWVLVLSIVPLMNRHFSKAPACLRACAWETKQERERAFFVSVNTSRWMVWVSHCGCAKTPVSVSHSLAAQCAWFYKRAWRGERNSEQGERLGGSDGLVVGGGLAELSREGGLQNDCTAINWWYPCTCTLMLMRARI